jgi:hypothetical protein
MKLYYSIAIMALGFAANAASANDLGINVVLEGEVKPGVYGRVELGRNSRPDLVYAEPRVIVVEEDHHHHHHDEPVYLHVPPGHARNWGRHCHAYHACSRQVYFVMSDEYREKPKPKHKHHHKHEHKKHKHH